MTEKKNTGGINHLYKLLYQFEEEGEKAFRQPRVTNEHSTGDPLIDEYIGGGYGRPNAYEIVMVFGDTGCIAGDAVIKFKSQYVKKPHNIKLSTLYKRFHGLPYVGWHSGHDDEKIFVRAKSRGNYPQWVEVEDVLDKGVRPVYKLSVGGKSVVATPDHRFYTQSGWKELKDLQIGDEVLVSGDVAKNKGGKKQIKNHIVHTKFHPRNRVRTVLGKYKYHVGVEHRLAYEAAKNGMSYSEYIELLNNYDGRELWTIPHGMEVHHIDGDHFNNNISNLALLTKAAHAKKGVKSSLKNFDYSDVFEKITKIEDAGISHVYDISCKKVHNFVANGFVVHNCNKSTFTTQMILQPALRGKRVTIFALEDDVTDVYSRIRRQSAKFGTSKFDNPIELIRKVSKNIIIAPESDGYTLEEMAREIESMFKTGSDIIVVDPLQFIFEASVVEKTETEFNRQRLFMRQINNMMKRVARETGKSKTIILVSHTNKGRYESALDNIMGSGANKQVPTKIIQVYRDDNGQKFLRLHKTRFTQHRFGAHPVELDTETMTFHTITTPPDRKPEEWIADIRRGWDHRGK